MNRTQVLAGSCIALLAILSAGELYLDRMSDVTTARLGPNEIPRQSPPPSETAPLTVEELIGHFMTGIEEGPEVGRLVTLGGLLDQLESPDYAKAAISSENGEALARAVVAAIEQPGMDAPESLRLKARLARFVAGRTRGETSRAFVMKVLDQGPSELRDAVLGVLGFPGGVGGKAVFTKVQELGSQGLLPPKVFPGVLRRTGGKKSAEPIINVMRSSDDRQVISACVIALQDLQDPSLLGPALERLEQTGMIDDPKAMPWIGSALLSKYLETAEGSSLARAIRVVRIRPSMAKSGLAALQKGLESSEADTRRHAADAIKKAVLGKYLDAKQGETLLAGRLDRETEPVLKAEMTGGLEQVRGLIEPLKAPESQQ